MVVIRVEHLTDRSCQVLLLYSLLIFTFIKGVQVKGIDRFRIPDTESIYDVVAVAYHRHVIRHGTDALLALLHKLCMAVVVLHIHITAEFNLDSVLVSLDLERVAVL